MNFIPSLKFVFLTAIAMALFATAATCQENKELLPLKKTWTEAIQKWEAQSGWQFKIPFPEERDIDYWRKQPLASVAVGAKQLHCTRPFARAYDYLTISFTVLPGDESLFKKSKNEFFARELECEFSLDEAGRLVMVSLKSEPDPWAKHGDLGQIDQEDNESAAKYAARVIATYRERSIKAKDPIEADRLLTVWEKVFQGILAQFPHGPK